MAPAGGPLGRGLVTWGLMGGWAGARAPSADSPPSAAVLAGAQEPEEGSLLGVMQNYVSKTAQDALNSQVAQQARYARPLPPALHRTCALSRLPGLRNRPAAVRREDGPLLQAPLPPPPPFPLGCPEWL